MAKPRTYFAFTAQMDAILCTIDDAEKKETLLHAIIGYGLYKRNPDLPQSLLATWENIILPQLDFQWRQYLNGSQGGAPKGNKNASKNNPKTTQKQPKNNPDSTQKQPNLLVEEVECEEVISGYEKQPAAEVVLGCFQRVKEKEEKENSPTLLKEKEVKELTKKENINTKEKKSSNSIEQRMAEFRETLLPYEGKYGAEMLEEFYIYWSEPTKDGKRMRYELNKTWSVGGRLATWYRHQTEHKQFATPLQRKMMDDQAIDIQRANHLYNLMNNERNSNNDQPPV